MPSATAKKPRRTPERILETSLGLFCRFGEPNVSTTLISAELRISPGNLYYHFPTKDALINTLFNRFEAEMLALLPKAEAIRQVAQAWRLVHELMELQWRYRFLYRDLSDLLSKNRHLETQFGLLLQAKARGMQALLSGLLRAHALHLERRDLERLLPTLVMVQTYWLSFEYAQNPRTALEMPGAAQALHRATVQVMGLLGPYLSPVESQALAELARSGPLLLEPGTSLGQIQATPMRQAECQPLEAAQVRVTQEG